MQWTSQALSFGFQKHWIEIPVLSFYAMVQIDVRQEKHVHMILILHSWRHLN